jgi:hypothetical protein
VKTRKSLFCISYKKAALILCLGREALGRGAGRLDPIKIEKFSEKTEWS